DEIYERPKHPYTQALLASQLSMDPAERVSEAPLAGDPPNPVNPPSGCRFHTRCPFAESVCSTTAPAMDKRADPTSHQVACHMHDLTSGHSRAGNPPHSLAQASQFVPKLAAIGA